MKDIDFDELDRAVSSLMNDVPKTEPVKNDDTKTLTLNSDVDSQVGSAQKPADAASDTAAAPADETITPPRSKSVSSPSPVAPAARRGRFMDMVRQPAGETRTPMPASAVSRHGATLQPIGSPRQTVVGNPIRPAVSAPKNQDAPTPSEVPAPVTVSQPAPEAAVAAETEVIESTMSVEASSTQPSSDQTPLSSPFLADAKVEKRPLGRPLDVTDMSNIPQNEDSSFDIEPSTTPVGKEGYSRSSDPDAQLPEQPLPAELDSKLLNIETSPADLPTESRAASSPVPPAKPLSATSIPQQYKIQPKAADANSTGTIYDTASYHQPLAHPAKKKPGWLWVVAIIVILLLGAAGGAVAYYMGLV